VILYSGSEYHRVVARLATEGAITLENLTEMLKGVLEGCVLEIIGRGETYGYEIASSLRTLGFADVIEGTVYTILLRLEKNQLVQIETRPSTKGPPRKFYSLNEAGQAELATFWTKWNFLSSKINELKETTHA
jgi:PadR family transcriptional regulator, regulatory protein PadR